MSRTVHVDEGVQRYLESLEVAGNATSGVIIGQADANRFYVVHLAKNHLSKSDKPGKFDLKLLDAHSVAEHAVGVTKLLPGGLHVLGIFLLSSDEVLSNQDNQKSIRNTLDAIRDGLKGSTSGLAGQVTMVMHYNTVTKRYTSKTVGLEKILTDPFYPAEWKFAVAPLKWIQINSSFCFDHPVFLNSVKSQKPFLDQLIESLDGIIPLLDTALFLLDGKLRSTAELILAEGNGKKDKHSSKRDKKKSAGHDITVCDAELLLNSNAVREDISTEQIETSIHIKGKIAIRSYVHSKATVQDGLTAVREDLLRSLFARIRLHADSLVTENEDEPSVLHQLPRRIFVPLPHSPLTVSDYIFPAEQVTDALDSLKLLLDVDVNVDDVESDVEHAPDERQLGTPCEETFPVMGEEIIVAPKSQALGALSISSAVIVAFLAFLFYLNYFR